MFAGGRFEARTAHASGAATNTRALLRVSEQRGVSSRTLSELI
jgi:hypothetical protein